MNLAHPAFLESPLQGLDFFNMKTPVTYYGGKQRMVPLILPLIPKHKLYCEPFAGGAAVFFAKQKSEMEVINDLNGYVVNLYQVCKTDFSKVAKLIHATPHSRKIYKETQDILKNPENHNKVKRAWAFWVQASMSYFAKIFGGYAFERKSKGTLQRFVNKKLKFTKEIADRLDWVSIECNDALQVIRSRDTNESFFYCDPPYFNSEMGHYKGYSEKDFSNLLELLSKIKGKFLLSSYPSDILARYTKKHKWFFYSTQKFIGVSDKTDKNKIEVLTANYDISALLKNNQSNVPGHGVIHVSKKLKIEASGLRLRLQLQKIP